MGPRVSHCAVVVPKQPWIRLRKQRDTAGCQLCIELPRFEFHVILHEKKPLYFVQSFKV